VSGTLTTLGDCCRIVSGSTPDTGVSAYWGGDIYWATPKDLSELSSAYIENTPRKLTKAGLDSCSAVALPIGSVLFSSRAPIGHVAINTVPMCTNQGFKSFVPNAKKVFNKYLYYWLKANKEQLQNLGNGATFKEVSKTTLSAVQILLPSLDEQRRLAAILDKADALLEKRRQAINKLNTLLQSVFFEMFGDPVSNPKGWKSVQLGEALELITYGLTVRPQYIDVGFPLISAREIRQGYIDFDNAPKISKEDFDRVSDKGKPKKDDILFSKTGSIGHSAIVLSDQAFAVSQNAARLKFSEEIVPEFGLHYLRLEMIQTLAKRTAKGNAVKDLQLGDMRKFPFYLPPIDLQRKFLSNQRKLEEVKATMRGSYSSAQTMFRSLQQRAFNGELFKHHG
jgi:type I restriction enzyme, S subunit